MPVNLAPIDPAALLPVAGVTLSYAEAAVKKPGRKDVLLIELAALRRENKQIKYLRPDAKSQVTLEYDDNNKPVRIDAIVVSTQHDDFDTDAKMQEKIKKDII